ncbi:MAG: hypothetical protein P4L99_06045 [Chthoniobacter sp.]|nr:hypothetical protein [Chthoniobacter sp.]
MNIAREFFKIPLFNRDESERFYEMLSEARNNPQVKLARFKMSMTLRRTVDLQVLALTFTAPNAT